jgi:hypothetical protein
MIVTENALSPYRTKRGILRISGGDAVYDNSFLPDRFFTPTDLVFRSDWSGPAGKDVRDPKQTLEIVLVLAFTGWVPILKPSREWFALEHQCGGHSCASVRMIATRLRSRQLVLPTLRQIAREGYNAETGHFDHHQLLASRIAAYVATLAKIGVDCECTWRHLTESLYPVDATQANLERVAQDAPDLGSIAEWEFFPLPRYSANPAILFMTRNCD